MGNAELRGAIVWLAAVAAVSAACSTSPSPRSARAPEPAPSGSSTPPATSASSADAAVPRGWVTQVARRTPSSTEWFAEEPAAREAAAREQRPLLVFFTAQWAAACTEMERDTFLDPAFLDASRRFVLARIDGTDQDDRRFARTAARYGVKGLPSIVLWSSKEGAVRVLVGKPALEELVTAMNAVP
jgi:thiol:disulfide interchange protein